MGNHADTILYPRASCGYFTIPGQCKGRKATVVRPVTIQERRDLEVNVESSGSGEIRRIKWSWTHNCWNSSNPKEEQLFDIISLTGLTTANIR